MNRASLVGGIFTGAEQRRGVEQARFVVTADSHGCVRLFQLAKECVGEILRFGSAWISANEGAADTQIENDTGGRTQVRFENGGGCVRVRSQPPLNFFALRRSGQTARIAKRIVRKPWMNCRKLFKSVPCGSFTDGHVRIVRHERFAKRGIRYANGEPHPDQRVDKTYFGSAEWECAVISRDDRTGCSERVFLAKNRIGGGDGGF